MLGFTSIANVFETYKQAHWTHFVGESLHTLPSYFIAICTRKTTTELHAVRVQHLDIRLKTY